ncbi:DEAD/DEAH box helicase family protein [Actinocorallia sp. A-T 12471]|uniref:DEAD/DEAH box helicase family protein n=1 Tax=Actinocorallia sp. A-T 12471 TaxID=3089813 RepID=UPI0029D0EA00|nr:DEAD/DEAH box helicase family protein [Actinocorallia sp. A-T 12471]MDX6738700.1 DEAD/DEAH box helicase family protein [Actinocorallia sp. A-T 12471]
MDARIRALADRSPNFGFLLQYEPLLVLYGAGAESAIFTDPNVALLKTRQFGEVLATDLVRRGRVRVDGDRQVDRLHALNREGFLHGDVGAAFHKIRDLGNHAVHDNLGVANAPADQRNAFEAVKTCFRLGVWFHRLLDGTREVRPFVPPQPPTVEGARATSDAAELAELRAVVEQAQEELAQSRLTFEHKASLLEAERDARRVAEEEAAHAQAGQAGLAAIIEQIQSQIADLQRRFESAQSTATLQQREDLLANAESASREPKNEVQVRQSLDRLLHEAGWSVQDVGVGLDLWASQGVAAREFTVQSGRADYLLYVNRKLVGVIEAKREGADLSAAEQQADRYADHLKSEQRRAAWRSTLTFRYASDGGVTTFRNTLDPDSRTRQVSYFHRPDTIARWMHDADHDPQAPTYRAKLRHRLPELVTDGLRPAQIDAIRGVERSLAAGRERALIQMATGAGKTFTACTFSYRLIKYAKAARVLFLVDRNNLGTQARTEFENFTTPDDGRKFTELYNVQQLTGSDMLASSSVVVSTIQRLYLGLSGKAIPQADDPELDEYEVEGELDLAYNPEFPPETFDLIVVDECHRSIYGKWRSVLDYFDAPLVGLTATPVAQTFGFFQQNLVSEYTYEQAVADNVNVDFNVYRIKTEISESGALIEAGTTVPVRDRRTRRQRYEDLDDDFQYAGKDVGNRVLSLGQMRTVIQAFKDRLYTEIFPERSNVPENKRMVPKTLIFARNDEHAEEIVSVVRDIFGRGNDFCAKITHKAKRPHELLAQFRNSATLRVAVTVDMIATGTDVKPLECLIFMRDVRSWSYFEQMKGRGARTIAQAELQAVTPDLQEKTRFVIVDAIGATENPKVDAAPLDRDPAKRENLEKLLAKVAAGTIGEQEVSTLASRLARLDKELNNQSAQKADIEQIAGRPLHDIVRGMVDAVSVDAQEVARRRGGEQAMQELLDHALEPLASNAELRKRLVETRRALDIITDEVNQDRVVFAGAILDADESKSMIESWREFLEENRDEITAWHTAYSQRSKPPHEVFAELRRLSQRISLPPRRWTPDRLWKAYEQAGITAERGSTRHGVADLVTVIRYELGIDEQPRPYEDIINERFTNWLARQEQAGARFTHDQIWWLENIAQTTALSVQFDTAALDDVPFSTRGGTDGFLASFGDDRAINILQELDQDLTA